MKQDLQTTHEARALGRFMADEDRAQAEDEAREVFEADLLDNQKTFSAFAKEYMDDADGLGSFLDWCWEKHRRGVEPAHSRAWEDE